MLSRRRLHPQGSTVRLAPDGESSWPLTPSLGESSFAKLHTRKECWESQSHQAERVLPPVGRTRTPGSGAQADNCYVNYRVMLRG